MAQSDDAARASLHYRANLPWGIRAAIAVVVVTALFPLLLLAIQAGTPSYVATPAASALSILVTEVLSTRDVVLSGEGRLTVTGLGRHIDVDVRCFTEIAVSAGARSGFGSARVRWNGGGFRIRPAMTYLPNPRHRLLKSRGFGNATEDFRDLVYRLYLINPSVRIRGIEPPAWALPAAMPHRANW